MHTYTYDIHVHVHAHASRQPISMFAYLFFVTSSSATTPLSLSFPDRCCLVLKRYDIYTQCTCTSIWYLAVIQNSITGQVCYSLSKCTNMYCQYWPTVYNCSPHCPAHLVKLCIYTSCTLVHLHTQLLQVSYYR